MGKPLRKVPIIGKDEEPFGIKIQSTDRVDPLLNALQKIHHRWPALRVLDGGDDVSRFVQKEDNRRFQAGDQLPIDLDMVPQRINFDAQLLDAPAVDRYSSLEDHSLGFSPRGHSRSGQYLLYSLQCQQNVTPQTL
jgi:hypothetical protein